MKRTLFDLPLFIAIAINANAQSVDLVGYWHNWNDASAPYVPLTQIDQQYSIIEVAFAIPAAGTSHQMEFVPDQISQAQMIADINTLQAQGRKVLISIGGATATVHLDTDLERDEFVVSMMNIINTYGFDGMDIDLEGSSVSISGGTITSPADLTVVRLINAVEQIMTQYRTQHGKKLFLTMAPETAYVQGGQSAYGGIWGAYLPIIDALRDSLDILQVQLYNSGSMFGIDGNIYTQGNADFIVSQTEALLQGFNTAGGWFAPLTPQQVAVGLPACPLAAGGGYTPPMDVVTAVKYLKGEQGQPGTYATLAQYPDLRGMMTWSVNWDMATGCSPVDELADTFVDAFGIVTSTTSVRRTGTMNVWPDPVAAGGMLHWRHSPSLKRVSILDGSGRTVERIPIKDRPNMVRVPHRLAPGAYHLLWEDEHSRPVMHDRFIVQ